MRKSKLGFVTASAAASFVVSEGNFKGVSSELIFPVSDTTTLNTEIETPSNITSAEIEAIIPVQRVEQWTEFEKRRYKNLVIKFATFELSETEKQELDGLEAARTRFEDIRSPEEIIAEFRTRQNYAAVLSSLKTASLGGNTGQ
jgi:hypothetical protein